MELATRRIYFAGFTSNPDEDWMIQAIRNLIHPDHPFCLSFLSYCGITQIRIGKVIGVIPLLRYRNQKERHPWKRALILPSAARGRNQGFEKLMKRPRAISRQLSALSLPTYA